MINFEKLTAFALALEELAADHELQVVDDNGLVFLPIYDKTTGGLAPEFYVKLRPKQSPNGHI